MSEVAPAVLINADHFAGQKKSKGGKAKTGAGSNAVATDSSSPPSALSLSDSTSSAALVSSDLPPAQPSVVRDVSDRKDKSAVEDDDSGARPLSHVSEEHVSLDQQLNLMTSLDSILQAFKEEFIDAIYDVLMSTLLIELRRCLGYLRAAVDSRISDGKAAQKAALNTLDQLVVIHSRLRHASSFLASILQYMDKLSSQASRANQFLRSALEKHEPLIRGGLDLVAKMDHSLRQHLAMPSYDFKEFLRSRAHADVLRGVEDDATALGRIYQQLVSEIAALETGSKARNQKALENINANLYLFPVSQQCAIC